jgi:hypothetical protein
MTELTRKERLSRCYFHQEQDRPAVYVRTAFPPDDPSYDRLKAYMAEHTERKAAWDTASCESHPRIERRLEPHSEDWELLVLTLHTPAGPLESTPLVSLKGQPGLDRTYFIKSPEDVETYLSLPMPGVGGDVSAHARCEEAVGEDGIAEAGLGHNPGGLAVELLGSELFAEMSITHRDLLYALCERRMNVLLNRLHYLLARDVGPFFSLSGEEFIIPPMHSPQDFRDFNVRYDRPILDLIHEAGGRVHVHCHGSIKKVIGDMVDAGIDVLHPFEPPPQGNVTAAEAKAAARGRMSLEGNIQIDRMYGCRPDEIREETLALIRDAFDDRRGLTVCPTASPYIRDEGEACFPAFQAMIDTVTEWRP